MTARPEYLIDISRSLSRFLQERLPTGVDRVNSEYVRRYGRNSQALVRFGGRWLTFSLRVSEQLFATVLDPQPKDVGFIRKAVAKSYLGLTHSIADGQILLNVGHSGLDDERYSANALRLRLQPVFFLHDLIPITHPEYNRPGESGRHSQRLRTVASCARAVVVNSRDTKVHFESWSRENVATMPSCTVAPLAGAQFLEPSEQRPIPSEYFVVLGTIEPRKNHLLLLNLWRDLLHGGGAVPKLVIVGQRGWECEQVVDLLDRCPALKGEVIEVGRCNDAALATWLRHAQALLFPSFVEGFGLPLVEALSLGTPIIASDLAVFREVAGNVPEYLHPLDGLGWRSAILDYSHAGGPRPDAQRQRMLGFRPPTWEQHFAIVDPILESIRGSS